ncbi:ankyrin repeat domain-containing protein [Stigmatella sp. ncwal1]|uniref:Ankyrin repeat domain-containing protein n=1 Tax=Stigmatella ashevillensis TaxID=2995309 RepID=A0ABT5DDF9_9BACT|nr:ankyrin repeat domain-containing protein [Stigmatella ashevillena]MDC0711717.1 ankyrin repeat domain-containing protein [Stigmatella ashevillena]
MDLLGFKLIVTPLLLLAASVAIRRWGDAMQRGATSNHPSSKLLQQTALGAAAYSGFEDVIRTLLAAGADLSRPGNHSGNSPREIAGAKGQSGAAKLLGA